ncbi:MAG: sensor histidine kinase [Planctomycetes bacterium]|nr:sensor histidine kinase [Planctomycetota bacterium]
MDTSELDKLAALIIQESQTLLARWRQGIRELPSAKHLDVPTLNDHIPQLLIELAAALRSRSDESIPEALCAGSPPEHGSQRVQDGFDIEEVVAEYNILRGCIHDLADENGLNLQGKPFHIVNRVLDEAIGLAVQTFATQRALEVQQRREEYLSFVAHDLRTPLNAISLAARVLEMKQLKLEADAETNQMLKSLRRNVQHLEGLVGKVLEENSSLQTEVGVKVERREFDLWPLVEALIHDLHPVAGTASTHLLNHVPNDLVVYADASLLRRVFQNLIANAIHYTPRGEVEIGAEALSEQGGVQCWVKDTGAGIPPEFLPRIFEIGESNPESGEGSGLGLAIVKTFVEAHAGQVTVESKEGVGTTIKFSLPPR